MRVSRLPKQLLTLTGVLKLSKKKLKQKLMEAKLRRNGESDFFTSLHFLDQHNGLRRGKLHILLGTAGGGKSTLTRTIVLDVLKNNKKAKVSTWLSEESVADYELEFFKSTGSVNNLDNASIKSEINLTDAREANEGFNNFLQEDSDVMIFDNITTSSLYDGKKVPEQTSFLKSMKAYANKTNAAVVLILHTSSNISRLHGHLITANDVRGARTVTNLAEFFYIVQGVSVSDKMTQFIFLDKHRGQSPESKIYMLTYDERKKYYSRDQPIKFEAFSEMFKERDKVK